MSKKNTVALVTGASSGMGKDFVKTLITEGMTVYAVARRVDRMKDLERMGAVVLPMDITNEEDIQNVAATIEAAHGSVDVLINNAGFGLFGAIEDITIEDARYQFEVNMFGLARLTQLVLPGMRQKRAGTIINISSIGGKMYSPLGGWYHATKHALEGWSDCLRLELKEFGINVVVVEPGAIKTEFIDVMNNNLMQRSAHGPYKRLANIMDKVSAREKKRGGGSDPSVISAVILKAIRARRPKTRYAAGKYSCIMLSMRKWFSDRMFDSALMAFTK